MPTSYPTIPQQVELFTDQRGEVALILLNGGLNDLNVRTVLNPTTTTGEITALVEQFCHLDMLKLLNTLAGFSKARIVVLGYYSILSEQSNLTLFEAFCMAAGLRLAGIPGAIVGGVVTALTKQLIVRTAARLRMNPRRSSARRWTRGTPCWPLRGSYSPTPASVPSTPL